MDLKKYNLSKWEIDELEEFMNYKNILDLLDFVPSDDWEDFLINLADGLFHLKHKTKEEI